ncbi:YqgQ family protein [Salimicrobium sp. PL1-032A]|uniref:YqgQ family protein n=1 Tax=Salimicrobium sp. PL1-032A TaxID=3095364 RepID=UPI0032609B07
MKTIYDIQQFLKRFGTFIYVGEREADLELMEAEVQELYKSQFMSTEDYQMAMLLLRSEIARTKDHRNREGEKVWKKKNT